jgi:hypothetical protein
MRGKKILYVDMDGVIADFEKEKGRQPKDSQESVTNMAK